MLCSLSYDHTYMYVYRTFRRFQKSRYEGVLAIYNNKIIVPSDWAAGHETKGDWERAGTTPPGERVYYMSCT